MSRDNERQGLLALAENLREAQLKANAIDATASQTGVYGAIEGPLLEVLMLLVGTAESARMVLDGVIDNGESIEYNLNYLYNQEVKAADRFLV